MPSNGISSRAGRYVNQPTGYRAFVPAPLPPNPPINLDGDLLCLLNDAALELGRLDGLTVILPNPDMFVSMYVHKEAVLSSQIEGTQASLDDVLAYEITSGRSRVPPDAIEPVNYVHAMNYGLNRLKKLPVSLRLIREIHRELLRSGRGSKRTPGEFRTSQNWIGPESCTLQTASFIPPAPHEMNLALNDLEKFLHTSSRIPLLIRCALAHSQFETIHPFLDGNGRVGRLLITFLLCHAGALKRPLLYLSYFFKEHRTEYYDWLNAVRFEGDWEGWVRFFLRGIIEVAKEAAYTANRILNLSSHHNELLRKAKPRAAANAMALLEYLFDQPYVTSRMVCKRLRVSAPTANSLIATFEKLGLLREITQQS